MPAAVGRLFRGRQGRDTISFYLFVLPWLLGFIGLSVFPLLVGLATSFTNYNGFNLDNLKFTGANNYLRAFNDVDVPFSLARTLYYSLVNVPLGLALALAVAMMLNQRVPARGAFRTLFYLPYIVPIVATVWIWRIFVDKNFGLLNAIISIVRPDTAIGWLVDYPTEVLVAMTIWTGMGGAMVIFLAGLQGIPSELKEAATMDGANGWQVFRNVTLPLLTPVVFFQLVMSIIYSLQMLVAPMLLAGQRLGQMPARDNYLYQVHVYQQVFVNNRYGYGTALLWLLFIVIVVLSLLVFRSSSYWVYYEVDQEGVKR